MIAPAKSRHLETAGVNYCSEIHGDGDMFRPEHVIDFYQLLGGGPRDAGWMRENMPRTPLAMLPDLTHYEIFGAPAMAEAVLPLLNGESGAKSWAEQMAK